MQTGLIIENNGLTSLSYSGSTAITYNYMVSLFFVELDPRVNASGLRVFDATINGSPLLRGIDVYASAGADNAYEIMSDAQKPFGPYADPVLIINLTSTPSSQYPPSIAAAEILQLFDEIMLSATIEADSNLLIVWINSLSFSSCVLP